MPKPQTKEEIAKETCFVIGNGESRLIWKDWNSLKGKGTIYGCNAITRDYPKLCDKIFVVNPDLYAKMCADRYKDGITGQIVGPNEISKWNYILENDKRKGFCPPGLSLYRIWQGGDTKKQKWRIIDLSKQRGSGCSAVLDAAEKGFKNIFIIGFDILGAKQWHYKKGIASREQNNVYKNTEHYPDRMNMKAYLKYEWMYQLTQIAKKFPNSRFMHINRTENIKHNIYLPHYIFYSGGNVRASNYGQLREFLTSPEGFWDYAAWMRR